MIYIYHRIYEAKKSSSIQASVDFSCIQKNLVLFHILVSMF